MSCSHYYDVYGSIWVYNTALDFPDGFGLYILTDASSDDASNTQASAAGGEEYQSVKATADADHAQVGLVAPLHFKPWREDSTADVNTMFRRVKGHKHLKTGVLEDGLKLTASDVLALADATK
ncbi:hypothetical protein C8R46DRAFT_1037789 [Mycena filopes]|nr:hypothetical protein C8R46DRAFT_1037789 [Mycena filopes]